jgi:predicted GNAT family N-acyltransferase
MIPHEITTPEGLQACLDLRREVFVDEQGVPADREMDGKDAEALHFALKEADRVIATCRVRRMSSAAKIERMAVSKDYRGKGIGRDLMKFVLQKLTHTDGIKLLKLSSQADAVPFYERLNFKKHGPEYMEVGIPHYDMSREL